VKGSKLVILILVIAVVAALVWYFMFPTGSGEKKTVPDKTAVSTNAATGQQTAAAESTTTPEPNQAQRGFEGRRGRRSRTGDSNEPSGSGPGGDFSGFAPGMDTGAGMGMDMGMGMEPGMWGGRSRRRDSSRDTVALDPNDPNPLEALNLQDVQMRNIIEKISQWTGQVVIPTNDSVMQQKVTIYSPNRIRRSEALALIFAALRAKGVAVEQSGNVIFLKPIPESRIGQVPVIAPDVPLASLTDKNQMVQKTFVLRNYKAAKMYTLVGPLVSSYGYVGVDENTGNLTVIETVENLMRLEKMVTRLDKPQPAGTEERIFQLTTGDAGAIAEVIEKLINTGTQFGDMEDPNKTTDKTTVTSIVLEQGADRVMLVPETKNNWIIARAKPEDMESIGLWIEKLDKELQVSPEYDILQVKYVDVTDLTDKVSKTLQSMPGVTLKSSVLLQPLPKSRQIMLFGSKEKRDMVRKLVTEIDQPGNAMFEERTFLLRHADSDSIKKNIDDLYSASTSTQNQLLTARFGPGGYGRGMQASSDPADTVKVISYPSLGQVTVIASPDNMTKIARQIEEWDIPVALDKLKPLIIELHNSDPVKMADLLSTLFSEDQSSSSSRNWFAAYIGAVTTDKQNIIGPLYGQLSFEAVPDTKKIIVISKIPAAYDVVEMLIHDLDKREPGEVPAVITLKYADPEDLAQRLNAMFNQTGTAATIPLSRTGLSTYTIDQTTGQATSEAGTDGTSTSTYSPWWTRARESTGEAPISNIIGKIRFIPDTRSKSIMVLSPKEYLDDITEMIQKLDMPAKQVMVQAVILEVNRENMLKLGAEYSANPDAFGQIGINGATALTRLTSASNTDVSSTSARPGTFNLTTTANISMLLDLLVTKANATIMNQPTLWTRDNEEATFFKGKSVPFIVSTQTSSEGTATKDSVEYRGVGVTLRVRPNITPEKAVDMTVNLMVSQLDPQLVNGNIATSLLDTTTKTIVGDGQTIMIGGIIYQTDTETVNKVPLLGDIPLIGAVFSHIDSQKVNNELIVFVTPYVIDTGITADNEAMVKQAEALQKMDAAKSELRKALKLDPNDVPEK